MKLKSLEKIIREAGVTFNDDVHTYVNALGEFYTGCTTIADAWKKEFIAPWYAKEAIGAVKEKLGSLYIALSEENLGEIDKLLTDAKFTASRKGKEAQAMGKIAHAYIQRIIGSNLSDGPHAGISWAEEPTEVQNSVISFVRWMGNKNIQWLASEEIVASHKYKIAGTLDALAIIDGVPTIVDFKTSSQLSESALLQCAGYHIMLSEMGFVVRQWVVLRIPKDGNPAEDIFVDDPELMNFYMDTFLHLREAHKFFVYADGHLKGHDGKLTTNKHPELLETTENVILEPKVAVNAVKKKIVRKKKTQQL